MKTRSDGLVPKMYWRDIWSNTLSESDTSGNMQNDYIYFGGKRIAYVTSSGSEYYYLTDQIGSVRKITDASGNICFDGDYTPDGDLVTITNTCPAQPYLFAGMERDDDQMDYSFARFYSWQVGRFMSPDPLGGDLFDPQSLNRYAYVVNNPGNLIDPFGLKVCTKPDGSIVSATSESGCEEACELLGVVCQWGSSNNGGAPTGGPPSNPPSIPGLNGGLGGGGGGGKCSPPATGAGVQLGGTATAAAGAGTLGGTAATGSAGVGGYYNSQTGANAGATASGGAVAYGGSGTAAVPQQGDQPFVAGVFVGYGPSVTFTTGGSSLQTQGSFQSFGVDVGLGVGQGSIQVSNANGVWSLSISGGVWPWSAGIGLSASYLRTKTAAASTSRCP
jgi:RHS repeat-associated protein